MRHVISSLALCLSLVAGGSALAYSGDGYEVCRLNPAGDNFLALRSGPGSGNAMILKLGPGSVVEARGEVAGGWLRVVVLRANGRQYLRDLPSGYVFTRYLCRI